MDFLVFISRIPIVFLFVIVSMNKTLINIVDSSAAEHTRFRERESQFNQLAAYLHLPPASERTPQQTSRKLMC